MKKRDTDFYLKTWTPGRTKDQPWGRLRAFWKELKHDIKEMGKRPATAIDYAQFYICVMIGLFIMLAGIFK